MFIRGLSRGFIMVVMVTHGYREKDKLIIFLDPADLS